jgi:hypothetical protein
LAAGLAGGGEALQDYGEGAARVMRGRRQPQSGQARARAAGVCPGAGAKFADHVLVYRVEAMPAEWIQLAGDEDDLQDEAGDSVGKFCAVWCTGLCITWVGCFTVSAAQPIFQELTQIEIYPIIYFDLKNVFFDK